MKDIIIKVKNPVYHKFFNAEHRIDYKQAVYGYGDGDGDNYLFPLFGKGSPVMYFKFEHKDAIPNALYEVSLKGEEIHLKFIKITGDNN